MSRCRFNDRKEADEVYEEERLNSIPRTTVLLRKCPTCNRTNCPRFKWYPEMERYGTCPEDTSCRLTER